MNKGRVYLVGAGCGDYDLITLRGLELIKKCDVLIYDSLVDKELLEYAENAEKICVGKRSGAHSETQKTINSLLIEKARENKTVVRLKGGDPFVFGRGGEEIIALKEGDIPFDIVPGISSAIAVPELAGIPVTHRLTSRSFHVITGHTADDVLPENMKAYAECGGTLYLVATPIGNLEDMTYRAVRILNEADLIAAEDTRNSIKLLNHFEIKTPMTSYHEFNKYDKAAYLVEKLLAGENIAVITDAGTPGISDPGEELVRQSLEAGITVTSVPGACACITALIISGQKTRRFAFEAFLPYDKKERERILKELQDETRTMIIYEAPHKLKKTLADLYDALGDRRITLCRELTKKHETVEPTTLAEAIDYYRENDPRGEYVIVVEGMDPEALAEAEKKQYDEISVVEHVKMYMDKGMSKKEAIKQAAVDRGVPKRDVYNEVIDM